MEWGRARRRTQEQTLETSLSWSRCSICLHLQKVIFWGAGEDTVLSLYIKRIEYTSRCTAYPWYSNLTGGRYEENV